MMTLLKHDSSPLVARFLVWRVGALGTWQKRIILIFKNRFVACDDNDNARESHGWSELKSATLGTAAKVNELTLHWELANNSKEVSTYVSEQRDQLLAVFYRQRDEATGRKPTSFAAIEIGHCEERRPVSLHVGGSYVDKYAADEAVAGSGERLVASYWLQQVERIIKFQQDNLQGILVRFSIGNVYRQYVFEKADARPHLIAALRQSLLENFGRELTIEEVKSVSVLADYKRQRHDALVQQLAGRKPVFACSNVRRHSRRTSQPKQRRLYLTSHELVIEQYPAPAAPQPAFIYLVQPLERLISLRVDPLDGELFGVQLTSGRTIWLRSAERESIVASLLELARLRGNTLLTVMFHDAEPGSKFNTPGAPLKPEFRQYVLRRLLSLTPAMAAADPAEALFVVCEFNNNVPAQDLQLKEKKVCHVLFGLLKAVAAHKHTSHGDSRRLMMAVFTALNRSLFIKGNYDEIFGRKEYLTQIFAHLKSDDISSSCAAAFLVQGLLNVRNNAYIRSTEAHVQMLFSGENVAALLAVLMDSVAERTNTLLVAAVLAVFELLLLSSPSLPPGTPAAANTPAVTASLTRNLAAKLLSLVDVFFRLCTFDCVAVARSAASVLYTLMSQHCPDSATLHRLQSAARLSTALLWQLHVAVNADAVDDVRRLAGKLLQLMVDGNADSLALLGRCLPRPLADLLREPSNDAQPTTPPQLLPTQQQRHQSTAGRWEHFLEALEHGEIETPQLIWNKYMRNELMFYLGEELAAFQRDKERFRKLKQVAWNADGFRVQYQCIANELCIHGYYISLLVKGSSVPPDCPSELTMSEPNTFMEKVFLRLLSESVNQHRVLLLRAMIWCYTMVRAFCMHYHMHHPANW
eukprot:TRINITY_DN675_c0_g1_i2.p1 TRINITY_DN675_c0_g1~~TRINITY_DN675_c0_g1_i2.p1  ORF type:complete len:866 (-),score=336.57 TRINITY_DN675_c0_g1_i2:174-2771(-)